MQLSKCFEILVGSQGRGASDRPESGLQPSADWDWVWDWVTLAWPKGHPSVTQGPSKGRFEEAPLFATKEEKGGRGRERSGDREIARDRVIGKPKPETTKDT